MYPQYDAAAALSVTELNEYARKLLAGDPLLRSLEVTGEISGYKRHYSGHRYFSLKDDGARVQCVMFRQQALGLDFEPADGMRVTVRASASIYTRDGSFQLYVTGMRQAGQGDLYARFERLKQKLQAEGLFDPARKRPIPELPRVIGVVTSQTGAAIRDIIHVARRRNPNVGILVSSCAVQGEGAAADIVRAIERLNRHGGCDVMLVGRGGGSIEDLWAFNEEPVARAIAASKIPVVSCVGHEIDFTIADFVADLRAPTPSAAAELAVPDRGELLQTLFLQESRMRALMSGRLARERRMRERLAQSRVLCRPEQWLDGYRMRLSEAERRLDESFSKGMEKRGERISRIAGQLTALNPLSVLARGYASVGREGSTVTRATQVCAGDTLTVRFADGTVTALAQAVEAEEKEKI